MTAPARVDPSLGARVVARTPLFYARGADPALDRPAHVRAGSALGRLGGRLAVVQDDASFLAILDGARVVDLPLPSHDGVRQFDDRRGNKKEKLDLEACIAIEGALVAFGSGSSDRRERIVVVDAPASVTLVEAPELYARMRAARDFSGAELNVEGAAIAGDDVVFFQRGNGAAGGSIAPVDATARVSLVALMDHLRGRGACPDLRDVTAWDLGAIEGTRLTFTDGVAARAPWIAFLACAEDCPDATRDGPVRGVAIGRLDDRARVAARAPVLDERGAPLLDKAEGLAFDDDPRRAWLVVDKDDPDVPSDLLELRLEEGWLA
ncbi:MAG: hypothetical protein KF819_21115 [Labilithrix sp.]|nr:hypothetical protein [Labilithrix sp.]